MTRTTPVASAQIPRRHDVVVLGWLYTAFMFLLTSGVRFLARGDAHFDLVPYLWVASVVLAGLAAAAVTPPTVNSARNGCGPPFCGCAGDPAPRSARASWTPWPRSEERRR